MLYIGIISIFIMTFMLLYVVMSYLGHDKIIIEERVIQLRDINNMGAEAAKGENRDIIKERFTDLYKVISRFLLKITPKNKLAALNRKLEKAGLFKNNGEKWLFYKGIIIIGVTVTLGGLAYIVEPNILKSSLIAGLTVIAMNTFFNFYLSRRIEFRKKKILKDLPFILDLITVSVEAGLSFDGAIARVVNNINGELCDEFAKCLKEIRMGIPRKLALRSMSRRCDVRELSLLTTSIIQADDLGVSLGKVLRIEANNLREHRKQVTREKAMKVPIKMLFPLIFFIFPSIFIIILGPAIIRIFDIFLR